MQLSQTIKLKEIELIIRAAFKFCVVLEMGFIKTTDHRPTDPPTTFQLPTDPSTCAGVSFQIKIQSWGLQLQYKNTPALVEIFCEFCKVFQKTYFGNACKRLLLKIKSLQVSFRKVSGFYYVDNCFRYICFKFPESLNRVIFQNLLFLRISQQTKTCSKSTTKIALELLQLMLFGCLYNQLLSYF